MRPGIPSNRLLAIDALRGLLIVVMALDHANHFIAQKHPPGEQWGGPFPSYASNLAFLTRLVTHLAAPGFFFLMGIGMVLFAQARTRDGWKRPRIVRHFLIRGLLLMLLQFLVVNRAWELSAGGWGLNIYVGVLFALGGSMIICSLLLWLRPGYLLLLTVVLFFGTELLHPSPDQWSTIGSNPLGLTFLYSGGDLTLWSNYPILPWLELVSFGLVFGYWIADDSEKAYERALKFGLVFLLLSSLIRYLDGFGNIRPRGGNSWIDYFNVVKYPPSMTFTLLTTGLNLVLLWFFSRISKARSVLLEPLAIFGRAPLFFYVLHLFLYAFLGLLLTPQGTSLVAMYPYWVLGLVILFPLCLWYARFKIARPAQSIWRLF